MKYPPLIAFPLLVVLLVMPALTGAAGAPTVVSYQGQVTVSGTPFTGAGHFKFAIVDGTGTTTYWSNDDTSTGGAEPDKPVELTVSNGLFSVLLGDPALDNMTDLPASALAHTDSLLRVWFSSDGSTFVQLSPDRRLAAAPYALQAEEARSAATAGDADLLDGLHAAALPYWSLTGNAGATPGTNYLGTSTNQALEIKVNAARPLRLEPNATSPNLIGGYSANWLTGGVAGATIGGGGAASYLNRVTDDYGTVGGGANNQAGDNAGTTTDTPYGTVGGGNGNTATGVWATAGGGYSNDATIAGATISGGVANTASGASATVGGGQTNTASGEAAAVAGGRDNTASGAYAAVGGGYSNDASASYATVAGGNDNTASGERAAIGGGSSNTATALHATVGGGYSNDATMLYATVGGGSSNTAGGQSATVGGGQTNTASGELATVPGGESNAAAGARSFAAGYRAKANNAGCFVWADVTAADYVCSTDNQFAVRATGGVTFATGTAGVEVNGNTAWHAGNDGAGSKLDADLLDGRHAAALGDPLHRASPPEDNVLTTVDTTGNAGMYTSITIGADGLPVVSYYDVTGQDLKVLHCGDAACTTGNTVATVDSTGDVGSHTSITIGADGLPVVSYYDDTNDHLKVLHCGDAACSTGNTAKTVDSSAEVGWYSSITIGADGLPVVSYYNVTYQDLKVLHCGDIACTTDNTATTVDSTGTVGPYTSITIGADGLPVVSYIYATSSDLKVLHCGDAACTTGNTDTTVDSTGSLGWHTSITIGADGLPVVSYYDDTNDRLQVLHCGNAACTTGNTETTVDATGQVGQHSSITIGVDGLPVISYYDDANDDLKVLHCGNAACTTGNTAMTADAAGVVGSYTSITIGADDLPVIAYHGYTGGDLKIAHCANAFCTPYFRRR